MDHFVLHSTCWRITIRTLSFAKASRSERIYQSEFVKPIVGSDSEVLISEFVESSGEWSSAGRIGRLNWFYWSNYPENLNTHNSPGLKTSRFSWTFPKFWNRWIFETPLAFEKTSQISKIWYGVWLVSHHPHLRSPTLHSCWNGFWICGKKERRWKIHVIDVKRNICVLKFI